MCKTFEDLLQRRRKQKVIEAEEFDEGRNARGVLDILRSRLQNRLAIYSPLSATIPSFLYLLIVIVPLETIIKCVLADTDVGF